MQRENLFQKFRVIVREYTVFPLPEHQHTFFELACIISGSGTFQVSAHRMRYGTGDLFLIQPNTSHVFEVDTYSHFVYLDFTEYFLNQYFTRQDTVLLKSGPVLGNVIDCPGDQNSICQLVSMIVREDACPGFYTDELISNWLRSVITLILRNLYIAGCHEEKPWPEEKIMQIIRYIQTHVTEPGLLQLAVLGREFQLSETYIGRYFKAHTNETLKRYILRCRLTCVEDLLLHTDKRINEIAAYMNFTDESHLTREFKKFNGVSPVDYRNKVRKR